MTVRDKDYGWKELERTFAEVGKNNPAATVGVQGDLAELMDDEHNGMTNVELFVIHEYGTADGRIKARSSIGATIDVELEYLQKELDKVGTGVFDGETPEGSLLILGEDLKNRILKRVKEGIDPALADATLINRPGNSNAPLWATGQMMGALTAVIVDSTDVERG